MPVPLLPREGTPLSVGDLAQEVHEDRSFISMRDDAADVDVVPDLRGFVDARFGRLPACHCREVACFDDEGAVAEFVVETSNIVLAEIAGCDVGDWGWRTTG